MEEVTGIGGRRCKQLLNDLKATRWYWKLTEEALGRTMWKVHFGRGYGPVVKRAAEWVNREQGSDSFKRAETTGDWRIFCDRLDILYSTFYHIRVPVESFNHIQCDTQDFNMLGDMNYYKMLQSAGKLPVGRTWIERRILYCTTPRNIQPMDSGSIDKRVIIFFSLSLSRNQQSEY
jgi:hypothetical protein